MFNVYAAFIGEGYLNECEFTGERSTPELASYWYSLRNSEKDCDKCNAGQDRKEEDCTECGGTGAKMVLCNACDRKDNEDCEVCHGFNKVESDFDECLACEGKKKILFYDGKTVGECPRCDGSFTQQGESFTVECMRFVDEMEAERIAEIVRNGSPLLVYPGDGYERADIWRKLVKERGGSEVVLEWEPE